MKTKDKINEILKNHSEAFDGKADEGYIADEDIPPIPTWFYDFKKERSRKTVKRNWYPIPIAAALVVIFFITPFGRTVARNLVETVFKFSDNSVEIQHGEVPAQEEVYQEEGSFSSAAAASEYCDEIIAANPNYTLSGEIKVIKDATTKSIYSQYDVNSGRIDLEQFIFEDIDGIGSTIEQKGELIDTHMNDSIRVVGYSDDETRYATAFHEKMQISFISEDVSYEDFILFIKGTVFTK